MDHQTQQRAMPKDGWCRQRTRGRLSLLLWAVLCLFIGAALAVFFFSTWMETKDHRETEAYIRLAVSGVLVPVAVLGGFYLTYVGIRDAFFPEKSSLARSIRAQLPFPDEAPPVGELFAMVDNDIRDNGLWFDNVAVGRDWVLGGEASYIPRIRAVFGRDEIQRRRTGNTTTTTRVLQVYIIDDRRQVQISDLKHPNELPMLLDCLKLRAPDAIFKPYAEFVSYSSMDDGEWEAVDRDYRNRKAKRASKAVQTGQRPEQNMVLSSIDGSVTSRVTADLIRQTLREAIELARSQDEVFFDLTPGRPPERDGVRYSLMQCAVFGSQLDEDRNQTCGLWVYLVLVPVPGPDGKPVRNSMELSCTPEQAEVILLAWLRGQVPDLRGWQEIDLSAAQIKYTTPQAPVQQPHPPRLVLFSASGAGPTGRTSPRR